MAHEQCLKLGAQEDSTLFKVVTLTAVCSGGVFYTAFVLFVYYKQLITL